MLQLCLTFDYELFFGVNKGSYAEVLFDQTDRLIDLLAEKNVHATFFADVCSIPVALRYGQDDYVEAFTNQILRMCRAGQDVQLHLHPHWLNSSWDGEKWIFTNKGYRLHEFGFSEDGMATRIIRDGIRYLTDTIAPVMPDYRCIAYRAGGFSLQPHEELIKALYDCGIRMDSSVAPWLHVDSDAHYYDYRHALNRLNWNLSSHGPWWQDVPGPDSLYEIPIATVNKSPLRFLFRRLTAPNSIKLDLGESRGTYITMPRNKQNKLQGYVQYLMGYNAVSMDAFAAPYLFEQVLCIQKKHTDEAGAVALIGHPKLVNEKYLLNLTELIDMIQGDHRFAITAVSEIYRTMENRNETD